MTEEVPPFELRRPRGARLPVLVEVPHAGLHFPDDDAALCTAPPSAVRADADPGADRLFDGVVARGATLLVARWSRYVADLNRDETDHDARSVAGSARADGAAQGVVWSATTSGLPALARPLARTELETRLARLHRPYHAALQAELAALQAEHGQVVLLSGHTMPSRGVATDGRTPPRRADVVPGSRGRSTAAPGVLDAVTAHFRGAGLSVRPDDPYRGGATTARYGAPGRGVHAVQLEMNRALFVDEATLRLRDDAVTWLRGLVAALVPRLAGAR